MLLSRIHLHEDGVRIWLCPSVCQKKLKYLLTSDTDVISLTLVSTYLTDVMAIASAVFFELFPIIRNISFISLQSQSQ